MTNHVLSSEDFLLLLLLHLCRLLRLSWLCTSPSRDLGLFRNPKRCDNIGDAEPNHVNSRTDDLNSCHFCLSEAINKTEYPFLKSDRLFGAWDA